jgi:protein TonB
MSDVNMKTTDTIKQKKIIVDLKELQKMAQYPGGLEKFYAKINAKFSNSEIDYEGFDKIKVSFVIEKDGSMSAIIVNDQTMSKSMKKSIERVLKSIKTKWSPAIIKDQPVRTEYELPLVFND